MSLSVIMPRVQTPTNNMVAWFWKPNAEKSEAKTVADPNIMAYEELIKTLDKSLSSDGHVQSLHSFGKYFFISKLDKERKEKLALKLIALTEKYGMSMRSDLRKVIEYMLEKINGGDISENVSKKIRAALNSTPLEMCQLSYELFIGELDRALYSKNIPPSFGIGFDEAHFDISKFSRVRNEKLAHKLIAVSEIYGCGIGSITRETIKNKLKLLLETDIAKSAKEQINAALKSVSLNVSGAYGAALACSSGACGSAPEVKDACDNVEDSY